MFAVAEAESRQTTPTDRFSRKTNAVFFALTAARAGPNAVRVGGRGSRRHAAARVSRLGYGPVADDRGVAGGAAVPAGCARRRPSRAARRRRRSVSGVPTSARG